MTSSKRLVFVVTEDWFFASHFLPMLRAASRAGFQPVVATRVREHAAAIEAAGGRVVALEANRRSLNPFSVLRDIARLSAMLRREKAGIVHCIALRSIIVGGAAARIARIPDRIFAVTGGGFLTARTDFAGRLTARALAFVVRGVLAGRSTRFLFENADDPRQFGLSPSDPRVTIVGGAGVDPSHYRPLSRERAGPLRVAIVSRMLWSKGVDLAVEAVGIARARGCAVELSLFGAPDPANPRAIPEETLAEWGCREGVSWRGVTRDVREVWADHDVACLPSRGGEGLPRTLLEAAACGRAIVTTDVPGCNAFVRDGTDGLVVPPDDPSALAEAFVRLAGDEALLRSMQVHARQRVEDGYTEAAVSAKVEAMYRGSRPSRRTPL